MKKSFALGILVLLFGILSAGLASSHHQEQVLGATDSSALTIPPTVAGPGFILPDSPLFFLDRIKQNVRLFVAFTPERRAKIRSDIAGERLAELRLMLARNNERGAQVALDGISQNFEGASYELSQAQLTGRNVSALAKEINTNIKEKQATLDTLEGQAKGAMKARVRAIQEAIRHSKITVEDSLPEADLQNEIRDALNRNMERNIGDATDVAANLERSIEVLNRQASEAATRSLLRKEEAIRKAIEQKNDALRKVEERLLENEKKKQENLLEAQKKASEQAREALKRAQQAAQGLKRAQERVNEIRNRPVGGTSDTSGSGSSGSNSSGSSGSGSGSSGSDED